MGNSLKKQKGKIGLLGGSFDPIHFGHINLAMQLMEYWGLTQVFFCPTYISPLKAPGFATADHRLKMVEIAIQDIPRFKIFDFEIKREGISYTVDTLEAMLRCFPERKDNLYLLLGEDCVYNFFNWRDNIKITQLAHLLIGSRNLEKSFKLTQEVAIPAHIKQALTEGMTEISLMDISSTNIRLRLKNQLYCGHLVPSKVLDYIYENQVYS